MTPCRFDRRLNTAQRRHLRAFLLQPKWFAGQSCPPLSPQQVATLKALPIFATHATAAAAAGTEAAGGELDGALNGVAAVLPGDDGSASAAVQRHCSLEGPPKFIPPADAAGLPLGSSFLQVCDKCRATLRAITRFGFVLRAYVDQEKVLQDSKRGALL